MFAGKAGSLGALRNVSSTLAGLALGPVLDDGAAVPNVARTDALTASTAVTAMSRFIQPLLVDPRW
jgi:hypothetical protein